MPMLRKENKMPKRNEELRRSENGEKGDSLKIIGVRVTRANGVTKGVQCGGNLKTDHSSDVARHVERQQIDSGSPRKTGDDNRPSAKSDGCHEPTSFDTDSTGNERLVIFDLSRNQNHYFSLCQEAFQRMKSTLKGSDEFESCFRAPYFCGGFIGDAGGYLQITDSEFSTTLYFPKGALTQKAAVTMLALPKPNNGTCGGETVLQLSVKVDFGHEHRESEVPALLFVKLTQCSAKLEVKCKMLDSSGEKTIPSFCGKVQNEAQPIHFGLVQLRQPGSYDLVITTPGSEDTRTQPTSTPAAGTSKTTTCPSAQTSTKPVPNDKSKKTPGEGVSGEKCDVRLEETHRKPMNNYRAGVFAKNVGAAAQLRVRIWKDDDVTKQKVGESERQLGSEMADADRRIHVITDVDVTMALQCEEWKFTGSNHRKETKQISRKEIFDDDNTDGASCTFTAISAAGGILIAKILLRNHGAECHGAVDFEILVGQPEGAAANALPEEQGVDAIFRRLYVKLRPERKMRNPLENDVHEELCTLLDTESYTGADIRSLASLIGIENSTIYSFTKNVTPKILSFSDCVINCYFFANRERDQNEVVAQLKSYLMEIGATKAATLLDTDSASVKSASTDSQISSSASVDSDLTTASYDEQSSARLKEVCTPDSGITSIPNTPTQDEKRQITDNAKNQ